MTRAQYEILNIDCAGLPMFVEPKSVQCCVTSPPYFGLRDYGVEEQIGLEDTPDAYVHRLVDVFRGVREVLRDDGVLWLNLGDSYARNGGVQAGGNRDAMHLEDKQSRMLKIPVGSGLKEKDLIGIPWMVAFALRADGWYLRQGIVWEKPNAMPESVRDRCASSHEFIFLLAKQPRYYFDHEAIKETAVGDPAHPRNRFDTKDYTVPGQKPQKRKARQGKNEELGKRAYAGFNERWNNKEAEDGTPPLRNKRSVWRVNTRPYKGAHFATFPPDLIEPCILAGSRPGDVVLDPFMGSGTTAQVAIQHGRRALGCELNPSYIQLAHERIAKVLPAKEEVDLFA